MFHCCWRFDLEAKLVVRVLAKHQWSYFDTKKASFQWKNAEIYLDDALLTTTATILQQAM